LRETLAFVPFDEARNVVVAVVAVVVIELFLVGGGRGVVGGVRCVSVERGGEGGGGWDVVGVAVV